LKALGVNPTMDTIQDRKRMQKLVYLFPKFGVDMKFDYNWHIYGPYSPPLAKSLYEIVEGESVVPDLPTERELSKIRKMAHFLGDDISSSDKLELLVSIAFLSDNIGGLKTKNAEQEIIAVLKQTKPYFNDEEIRQALEKVRRLEQGRS